MVKCEIKGCDKQHKAKGYCNTHYTLYKRTGNPLSTKRRTKIDIKSDELIKSTYVSYYNILNRVLRENTPAYKNYGMRGITICEEWKNSFDNFFLDMGAKPTIKHTIERINNDLGYFKENCKWATPLEQVYNRRPQHNNTTGVVGVTYDKRWNGSWVARANDGKGNRKSLGSFKTKEEAVECILKYKSSEEYLNKIKC